MRKKRINIAQLHWGFPPIIGGVETHLTLLLPTFVKWGHAVSLLTGSCEGVKTRYVYKGVGIWRSPLMDLNWLSERGIEGIEEDVDRLFRDFFRSVKPDIIHVHNMHYFSEIHAQKLADFVLKKKIPLILTAHNVWDDSLFLELSKEINWSHIIAVSHFIKRELIGVGYSEKKITVVHHGIDTKMFRPNLDTKRIQKRFPQLKDRRVIFHPARIGLAKGCDTGVKALSLIKKHFPDIILVMAGAKNIIDWGSTQQRDIAYIVELIRTLKLEKNVLIDVFSLKEVAQIYSLAKLCIYPSSSPEPFGLTMLEALSSGKPIIVTNMGGMPEIIQDGINGFVIRVRDFEALASRVIRLLEDDILRERLGSTGRQMLLGQYRKERMARDILTIYEKILGR